MVIKITSRRSNLEDAFKERVEKKLSKLDKFFPRDAVADVVVTTEKDEERERVEITIKSNGFVYRSEKTTADMFDSLECVVDAIVKQIVKNKTRLAKKHKLSGFEPLAEESAFEDAQEEPEYKIVKRKLYTAKPMLPDEAILQMNMVDHDFFIFTNAQTGQINIVYKRRKGDYGLIVPSDDE